MLKYEYTEKFTGRHIKIMEFIEVTCIDCEWSACISWEEFYRLAYAYCQVDMLHAVTWQYKIVHVPHK